MEYCYKYESKKNIKTYIIIYKYLLISYIFIIKMKKYVTIKILNDIFI